MTTRRTLQAPDAVVMVRPARFRPNAETAADNAFQRLAAADPDAVARAAWQEVGDAAAALQAAGVRVHLFEDDGTRDTPDSVFPNNWFTTHPGGHVAIHPMCSPSRRRERRADVVELLKREYRVQDVVDHSGLEPDGLFLEGTGAMVFDHFERVAYTARSHRAHPVALERFCSQFHYEPVVFDTADAQGRPIYHTNVLMCVATGFALVALDAFTLPERAAEVRQRLEASGRTVLPLSHAQVAEFAGNAIELSGRDGLLLACSRRGWNSLDPAQRALIEQHARPLPLEVPTIELAGGSVRCMIAGVHLSRRGASPAW